MLNDRRRCIEGWQEAAHELLLDFTKSRLAELPRPSELWSELGAPSGREPTPDELRGIARKMRSEIGRTFERVLAHEFWSAIYREVCTVDGTALRDARLAELLDVDRTTIHRWCKGERPVPLGKLLRAMWMVGLEWRAVPEVCRFSDIVFSACRSALRYCHRLSTGESDEASGWGPAGPGGEEMLCLFFTFREPEWARDATDEVAASIARQIAGTGLIAEPAIRSVDRIRGVLNQYGEAWLLFESTISFELF